MAINKLLSAGVAMPPKTKTKNECKGQHNGVISCYFIWVFRGVVTNFACTASYGCQQKNIRKYTQCLSLHLNTTPGRFRTNNFVQCAGCSCVYIVLYTIRVKPPATYPKPFIMRISGCRYYVFKCISPCYCARSAIVVALWCDTRIRQRRV